MISDVFSYVILFHNVEEMEDVVPTYLATTPSRLVTSDNQEYKSFPIN